MAKRELQDMLEMFADGNGFGDPEVATKRGAAPTGGVGRATTEDGCSS